MKPGLTFTLALAVLATLALPTAAPARADAAPAAIVGKWTRNVTAADIKRRGSVGMEPATWRFEVKAGGAMSLFNGATKRPVATGTLGAGAAGTLTMLTLKVTGGGTCGKATYRWRLASGRLTLTTPSDKCPGRGVVLVGTWRKA